jgi:hypothetical protein
VVLVVVVVVAAVVLVEVVVVVVVVAVVVVDAIVAAAVVVVVDSKFMKTQNAEDMVMITLLPLNSAINEDSTQPQGMQQAREQQYALTCMYT